MATEGAPEAGRAEIDETTTRPAPGLGFIQATPPYDAQRQHDSVRSQLAFYLVGILGVLVLGTFVLLATRRWTGLSPTDIRTIVELLVTPVVTLVSAAAGFYFGAHAASQRGRSGR